MKYWEIIADRLHAHGWSYGIAEHFAQHGFFFCVDAHRDGKRFIVKADDLLKHFFRWRDRANSLLTPVPKRIGLKSYITLSGVLVKCLRLRSPTFQPIFGQTEEVCGAGC